MGKGWWAGAGESECEGTRRRRRASVPAEFKQGRSLRWLLLRVHPDIGRALSSEGAKTWTRQPHSPPSNHKQPDV